MAENTWCGHGMASVAVMGVGGGRGKGQNVRTGQAWRQDDILLPGELGRSLGPEAPSCPSCLPLVSSQEKNSRRTRHRLSSANEECTRESPLLRGETGRAQRTAVPRVRVATFY